MIRDIQGQPGLHESLSQKTQCLCCPLGKEWEDLKHIGLLLRERAMQQGFRKGPVKAACVAPNDGTVLGSKKGNGQAHDTW